MSSLRFALIALACLLLGGLGGILIAHADDSPARAERFLPPRTAPPTFSLADQDGRRVTPQTARGDVLVLTFFYSTCRTLCPAQAQEIKTAVGRAKVSDVHVYAVSVDPVGDTLANIRGFLRRTGLGGTVRFLHGTRAELEPVWRQYGVVPLNASPEEAAAAAAAFDAQHGGGEAEDPEADEYAHCPGGAAGYAQYEAAAGEEEHEREEEEEEGCEQDEPPAAAEESYPDTRDLRYRGRPRHGSWDFEHTAYVLLIDRHGRQRVGFPFEQLTAQRLAQDIRILSAET